jgi:hypothetical protein
VIASAEPEGIRQQREQFTALLEQFGKGWEKGKADIMASVFAPDAAFMPSPFDEPVKGQGQIELYWKDVPLEQAEVQFRIGEIFLVGPWFAAEYKCTFRRRRTGEWMDIRGALFCESEGDKIKEMRMYWHRNVDTQAG